MIFQIINVKRWKPLSLILTVYYPILLRICSHFKPEHFSKSIFQYNIRDCYFGCLFKFCSQLAYFSGFKFNLIITYGMSIRRALYSSIFKAQINQFGNVISTMIFAFIIKIQYIGWFTSYALVIMKILTVSNR